MCIWCAYSGSRPAAPLLLETLRKTEGIWGGYYTGLVTLDRDGMLRHGKCAGHSGLWEQQFSAADFPGGTGLIHSRTNSGGDHRFAHPFVGCRGRVAAVSQGSSGIFAGSTHLFIAAGNRLLAQGRTFAGATPPDERKYRVQLADGSRVPLSEIVTTAVEEAYERLNDPIRAIREVCGSLPEESATLFLFSDRPGVIGFVNVNQHIVYSRTDDGVQLSVTALGVPGFAAEIPGNTVGIISPEELHVEELGTKFAVDSNIPDGTVDAVADYLRKHPGSLLGTVTDQAVGPLFEANGRLQYRAATAYRALETLYRERRIRFEPEEVSGSTGTPGRIFRIFSV